MTSTNKRLAFFKTRTTSSMPVRQGPIQCVRNCTHCIIRQSNNNQSYDKVISEEMIAIKSFDNLILRKPLWLCPFETVQYHIGQIDVLRVALKSRPSDAPIIYVMASSRPSDVIYLNMVLEHSKLQTVSLKNVKTSERRIVEILKSDKAVAIPILLRSCRRIKGLCWPLEELRNSFSRKRDNFSIGVEALKELLNPLVDSALDDTDYSIVPVAITKDHDNEVPISMGSVCVQILEPYSLNAYLNRLSNPSKITHLTQHICYDVSNNAIVLSPHIIAFLVLNLEREAGVSKEDLVKYINWFRKVSLDLNIHFGFTGDAEKVIQFAQIILADLITFDSATNIYRANNIHGLMDYANLIIPMIAYYGLIGRAILAEHNKNKKVEDVSTCLPVGIQVKVEKDAVFEYSCKLAEWLEMNVPCRRPCRSIETSVAQVFDHMQVFGRYFKVEEPKLRKSRAPDWASDFDFEDRTFDYDSDNPALKSWIVLTERENRIDRLNLFMNSIETYL